MKSPISRSSVFLPTVSALAVVLFPAVAFAAADAPTSIERVSSDIMNILIPVFVAFVGSLATWALHKVQRKLGLEVSEKTMEAWEALSRRAALRGAEWARKKTKELTEGKKIPGGEVMEVAANWALEMAENQKLPALARNKLEGLIEAHLFELRLTEDESTSI